MIFLIVASTPLLAKHAPNSPLLPYKFSVARDVPVAISNCMYFYVVLKYDSVLSYKRVKEKKNTQLCYLYVHCAINKEMEKMSEKAVVEKKLDKHFTDRSSDLRELIPEPKLT